MHTQKYAELHCLSDKTATIPRQTHSHTLSTIIPSLLLQLPSLQLLIPNIRGFLKISIWELSSLKLHSCGYRPEKAL